MRISVAKGQGRQISLISLVQNHGPLDLDAEDERADDVIQAVDWGSWDHGVVSEVVVTT